MATRPGINPTFEMAVFNAREQRIIRRLAEHFYITRAASTLQVGNSNYRSFLMRPAEDASVALNVEREVAVLFADYETFEARTLHAFDLTYDQFDDVRVDRSLRFLISRDQQIHSSIQHYLLQNPEYPIVVPFHFDELLTYTNSAFFQSIRKNYLVRDLFGYQSPLKQEYFFFGRSTLVEGVLDLHKSGQNSSLFGLRKSGKTSTIYAIQRRAKAAGCKTLIIDCQDPAVHARAFGSLLEYIVGRARSELNLKKIGTSMGATPDAISENFRRLMTQTLNDAQSDILLIFDEIENISPRTAASAHWRQGSDSLLFWQTLRSFFQDSKKFRLTFCFVGTNPHLFEMTRITEVDNPVYLFAPKNFIPMLSQSETREMITRLGYFMGLDFEEQVISYIHGRFGGHPFFTRQLCSQVHKRTSLQRPQKVSLTACKLAEQDVGSDIAGYLSDILNSLRGFYPEEYEMLEYLATGRITDFSELASYSSAYVEHLMGYGIIVRRGDDYEFSFDAVAAAVKANLVSSKDSSLGEKRSEISRRRNVIEEELRSFLYRSSARLTQDEWMERYNSCMSSGRRSQLGSLTRREAFSRLHSPLYFMELLKFVKHCDDFSTDSAVSLEEILSAMDCVNKHRIDAHAQAISETDFSEALRAIEVLESVFLPP